MIGETNTCFNDLFSFRYIRNYTNGSTSNSYNHFIELQVFDDTNFNVSANKPVSLIQGSNRGSQAISTFVDGTINNNYYIDISSVSNSACLQVDLLKIYNIKKIGLWHYCDGRKYHNNIIKVSKDGTNFYTLYDSSIHGEYKEVIQGFWIYA